MVPAYSDRNTPRSWSSGTTVSANSSSPPGVMCGTRMNPSLASACTKSLIVAATVAGEPMNDCRPVTSMISSRSDRRSAAAFSRHCRAVATGSRCMRTLARPRAMVFSPGSGSISGSGPSGS